MTPLQPAYRAVRLFIENGSILCHYYDAPEATGAVLWLGGAGGGFDSPAKDLFDRLAAALTDQRVRSLRVRYRTPAELDRCIEDALVGVQFLVQNGVSRVVAVGYSLGGAVAIEAGASAPTVVKGVAVVASQSYGTGAVDRITPRPVLIVHGDQDQITPPECAAYIYEHADEPKQLVLIPGADHCFTLHGAELQRTLEGFLREILGGGQTRAA